MIREMLSNTWFWALAGLFLMAAEIILPGIYLMFVGGAALVVAVLFWLVPGFPIWLAAVIFVSLVVVGILWGRHLSRTQDGEQAQALNDREACWLVARLFWSASQHQVREPSRLVTPRGGRNGRAMIRHPAM